MYADDIIVFATSPEALQKLLDCVNTFCDKWNMTIKIKVYYILNEKKNKRNEKDFFTIGTTELENVTEYTYLGLKINAAGSFQNSLDMLSEKANRAKFALNNKAKLKQIPVKIALRLFDAVVLPIMTYGPETWALHLTLDHDK